MREEARESKPCLLAAELHLLAGAIGMLAALWGGVATASAQNVLAEPPTSVSQNGVLDIMMVAMPSPISTIIYSPPDGSGRICAAWSTGRILAPVIA